VQAHTPGIMKAAKALSAAVDRSGLLPKALLPLVYLRVALINGCPFWIDINSSRGLRAGASEDKLHEITAFATSAHYSAAERAALSYAEAMTITGQKVTDELFAEVRRHFSEAQVVELTAAVALENFRSKFNVALGVESQGFCLVR
jgi:AhpD family alkylhydroperoxidase